MESEGEEERLGKSACRGSRVSAIRAGRHVGATEVFYACQMRVLVSDLTLNSLRDPRECDPLTFECEHSNRTRLSAYPVSVLSGSPGYASVSRSAPRRAARRSDTRRRTTGINGPDVRGRLYGLCPVVEIASTGEALFPRVLATLDCREMG